MNRKAFLSTIAALFTAPFLSKGEKQPSQEDIKTAEDIARYYKVPPSFIGYSEPYQQPPYPVFTIKDSDLQDLFKNYSKGMKS